MSLRRGVRGLSGDGSSCAVGGLPVGEFLIQGKGVGVKLVAGILDLERDTQVSKRSVDAAVDR